jgi:3-deoxy-7-phosphoheptulonate synthase
MASGLSMPVGVKNGTDGNLDVAINALLSLSKPHSFLGIDQEGCTAIVRTRGNRYGHVVLRGGSQPNYDSVHVKLAETALVDAGLRPNLMVDCSHANSNKDAALQPLVADNVAQQIVEGNTSLVGLMLESNLGWGNQKMTADLKALKHGVSITDACIDWATTERVLRDLRGRVKNTLHKRRIAA